MKLTTDAIDDFDELFELFELIAGQRKLVRINRCYVQGRDLYYVMVNDLPNGFYSLTEVESFTTETPPSCVTASRWACM